MFRDLHLLICASHFAIVLPSTLPMQLKMQAFSLSHSSKTLLLALAILSIMQLQTDRSRAQEKTMLSMGADVLVPIGRFKENALIGFGATGRVEFLLSRMVALTITSGYASWNSKSGSGVYLKGVPVRGGIKYYLMPENGNRLYGIGEIGAFFSSNAGEASTDLSFAPILGFEVLIGLQTRIDFSARYDFIATPGNSSANIGFRTGLNFGI